jgi:hypothetical protein
MSGSRHLSPLSNRRRPSYSNKEPICEFGSNHVSRAEHSRICDELEERLRRLQASSDLRKAETEEELLKYHNELADSQKQVQDLEEKVRACEQAALQVVQRLKNLEDSHTRQSRDLQQAKAANRNLEEFRNQAQKNTGEQDRKTIELQQRVAELLKRPAPEELDQERRKNVRLEKEITRLSTQPELSLLPFINLHQGLGKVQPANAPNIANALVEQITFDLNEIWTHLPHPAEESLITPNTSRLEALLEKIRKAVTLDQARDRDLERKLGFCQEQLEEYRRAAQAAANAAAHRKDQPVPTPKQLEQIAKGLASQESHADELAIHNQAKIFEWENVGLRLCPNKDDIPPTVEAATIQILALYQRLRDLERDQNHLRKLQKAWQKTILLAWSDPRGSPLGSGEHGPP